MTKRWREADIFTFSLVFLFNFFPQEYFISTLQNRCTPLRWNLYLFSMTFFLKYQFKMAIRKISSTRTETILLYSYTIWLKIIYIYILISYYLYPSKILCFTTNTLIFLGVRVTMHKTGVLCSTLKEHFFIFKFWCKPQKTNHSAYSVLTNTLSLFTITYLCFSCKLTQII